MTITIQPIDASAGSPAYTAQQERQALSALLGGGSPRALGAVSGFRVGTQPSVVSVTSTTWTVNPCSAIIDPVASTTQGAYRWSTDVAVTGAVTAANATNPRKDILYIQVNDASAGDGSGARNANILYLAGTPAASPVPPALPARSFLVATISVPTAGGGSPTIAFNATYSVAAGAILPVSSQAVRDALTPYDGLAVWRTDLDQVQIYSGSAWLSVTHDDMPFGHMGKTDGFQSISSSATITMAAAQTLRGGMTFDNATDSLVIPKTGLYRVTERFYCSGGSTGRHTSAVMKLPAGGGGAVIVGGVAVHLWKADASDWASFATGTAVLTAGDKVYMTGNGPANAYGGDGVNGCWLEVEYIGS